MGKTIAEMTAEIRAVNIEKGWRPADGGPGENTWGDYVALLHSEISEALEAYRDHRLADATRPAICNDARCDRFHRSNPRLGDADFGLGTPCPPEHLVMRKPEGVGSELADVLIRLLDMCDVFGIKPFNMDMELDDVADGLLAPVGGLASFGDHLALLHFQVSAAWLPPGNEWPSVLLALLAVARKFGIDLEAEYERKISYNRTREFRHGGRCL